MSLEELIERRLHGKIIARKMTLSQEVRRSIYLLIFTLLSIIVLLGIVFLLNTSQSNQKGATIKQQEVEKNNFELKNRELNDKITDSQSLKTIKESDIIKKMEKPETPIYIEPKTVPKNN